MNESVTHIRAGNLVYERSGDKFVLAKEYKGVNDAKRFTRVLPKGSVRRRESIIAECGEKAYNALIST